MADDQLPDADPQTARDPDFSPPSPDGGGLAASDDPLVDARGWPPQRIIVVGCVVEGGLALLAMLLAFAFGFYDRSQPLQSLFNRSAIWPVAVGLLGTLPMLIGFFWIYYRPFGPLRGLKSFVTEKFAPFFVEMSWPQLLLLSLLAGVGEELLFRWSLQGALQSLIGGNANWLWALLIASLLFGLCHYVTTTYAILATIAGLYLGAMMLLTDNVLAPMVSHALYDFVALMVIARTTSGRESSEGHESTIAGSR